MVALFIENATLLGVEPGDEVGIEGLPAPPVGNDGRPMSELHRVTQERARDGVRSDEIVEHDRRAALRHR